jgi:hypothetical protein
MKTKMGRPKLPEGKARDFQIGVRFTKVEADKIHKAIINSGMAKPEWARKVLMAAT